MQTLLLDKPQDRFEEDFNQALEKVWDELNAEEANRVDEEEILD